MKRPGVIVDSLVDEAIERNRNLISRDEEFIARFGKWERPAFARRYGLERMMQLIDWSRIDPSILECAPFINQLAPEDRRIAGEIARFCLEEIEGKPATNSTLTQFRLTFARRLDACGF